MKSEIVALVLLDRPWSAYPTERFFVQAKLPTDGESHPYGRWSLGVEPIGRAGDGLLAHVDFVASQAPRSLLQNGLTLELFRGPKRVGTARIARAPSMRGLDRDFLASVRGAPRADDDEQAA